MAGLVISAGAEVEFSSVGMSLAFLQCLLESLLNVYTKSLTDTQGAVTLQLYSAFSAAAMLLPFLYYVQDMSKLTDLAYVHALGLLGPVVCGALGFHAQWISQFMFMEYVNAVSLSVANVVKRGVIIYLSTLYFAHAINATGYAGLAIMGVGLGLYTWASSSSSSSKASSSSSSLSSMISSMGGSVGAGGGDGKYASDEEDDTFFSVADSDSDSDEEIGISRGPSLRSSGSRNAAGRTSSKERKSIKSIKPPRSFI